MNIDNIYKLKSVLLVFVEYIDGFKFKGPRTLYMEIGLPVKLAENLGNDSFCIPDK